MSTPARRPKRAEPLNKLEVAKVAAEPNPLPDWVTETPEESIFYDLNMWSEYDPNIERVKLTRAEYIWLKCVLADLRGYNVPDSAWKEDAA